MKRNILIVLFAFTYFQTFSQSIQPKNTYLKFSGEQLSFGTGDFSGYSFSFEASKNIIKKSNWGFDKLLIGGELIFLPGESSTINIPRRCVRWLCELGLWHPIAIGSPFMKTETKVIHSKMPVKRQIPEPDGAYFITFT